MLKRDRENRWRRVGIGSVAIAILAYGLGCVAIASRQRQWIFNPKNDMLMTPDQPPVHLDYESIQIPVLPVQHELDAVRSTSAHSTASTTLSEQIQGWWIPASSSRPPVLANEPYRIATSVNVILYLGGRGGNRSYHLPRIEGFHQLGFSVLMADYRGYGDSDYRQPSEATVYQDAAAAWRYLTETQGIAPEQILIYGESLGGAIALELALQQPDAGGLVLQSTFTSMADMADQVTFFRFFPIRTLITERFASLDKIGDLQVPLLLLHGTNDEVVPYEMSEMLYAAAPSPKDLFLIPEGSHFQIYRPGDLSYLKAIERFLGRVTK